ncbi:MAG: hypothetical protein K0S65_867 [Labilithrix sp.]|nr:hypothetical protein [Labilithrix sp.]
MSAAVVRVGGSLQVDPTSALVAGKNGARGSGGFPGVGSRSGEAGEEGLELTDAPAILEL